MEEGQCALTAPYQRVPSADVMWQRMIPGEWSTSDTCQPDGVRSLPSDHSISLREFSDSAFLPLVSCIKYFIK